VRALARNYAESRPGELFAIIGGSGYLEVSVGQGSAAERIGCEAGAAVELRFV
jgi:S-adenosylmethionine hydrolase